MNTAFNLNNLIILSTMKHLTFCMLLISVLLLSGCANKNELAQKGNVNASCKTNEECVTPVQYLVQNTCPHFSLCVENKCKVVCSRILNSDEDPNHPQEDIPYISPQVKCDTNSECTKSCSLKEEYGEYSLNEYGEYSLNGVCVEASCYCIKAE